MISLFPCDSFMSGKIWLNLEQSVLGLVSLGSLPWSKWPLTALHPLGWGVPRLGPPSCSVPQISTYILHSNPVPPPPRELRQRLSTVHPCRSTACHVVAVQCRQTSFYFTYLFSFLQTSFYCVSLYCIFTNWRFVATLSWASPSGPFCQQYLLPSCICVTFW